MTTRASSSSDEDWCVVSGAEDSDESCASSDEVEPEPALVPRYVASPCCVSTDGSCLEATETVAPLPDASTSAELPDQRAARYSRAERLALLAPEHRGRLEIGAGASGLAKPNVRVGFASPRSYPDRVRATVASFRVAEASGEPSRPEFTPVEPFTRDYAAQTDPPARSEARAETDAVGGASRVGLLRAALDRTLALSAQLRAKSEECERLSLRAAELQQRLRAADSRPRGAEQLESYRRSMALANERLALGLEYQSRLRGSIADLRDENESLARQNAVLSGQERDLSGQSARKLEALEDALVRAMDNVRAALRAKYRAARTETQTAAPASEADERCVVCLDERATVKAVPCGHRVLCPACAVRVDACPVDRRPIEDKVLTFGMSAYTSE